MKRRSMLRRLSLAIAVTLAAWLAWEAWRWPDVAELVATDPPTTAFIERYRAARRRDGESDSVAWSWVSYDRISRHLKRAVLVAEDIDFLSHRGFAVGELRIALREAVAAREAPRGASTISQQLAKNLWLSPSRDPLRKAKEIILTWQLERRLSKRRILELYLNVAELGPGIYGAEAAAQRYFGKSAAALGPQEAAELAACLPRPSSWHPGSASGGYRDQVERIERRAEKASWLLKQL